MPPKFVPLKIKLGSPKAYKLGLVFMRLNGGEGAARGSQAEHQGPCSSAGAAEPREAELSAGTNTSAHALPQLPPCSCEVQAGTETSPVARQAWQITRAAHVCHLNPLNRDCTAQEGENFRPAKPLHQDKSLWELQRQPTGEAVG